ncbi:MAG: trypsin-like peptidase domain-containing protein [Polyangiaceae bacterium]|nr:trypsin-like peptidase domain-containing protein [Polyangiaceae bacterium]
MVLLAMATWQSEATASPDAAPWSGDLAIRACEPERLEMPKAAEKALLATLLIKAGKRQGSAVLVSPDGFALTAAHVVGDRDSVTVVTNRLVELEATVQRLDERSDVALLHVKYPVDAPCLAPAAERASVGSDIFVLGSPGGEEFAFSLAKGIVSGYRDFDGSAFVQLDASVSPGNSGGPVVDVLAHVVGLVSWKVSHVSIEGLAFAVPIREAMEALDLHLGDATDPSWAKRGGRRLEERRTDGHSVEGPRAAAAPPDAVRSPAVGPPVAPKGLSSGQIGLIAGGSVVGGIGLTAIVTTGGIYATTDEMTMGAWDALVGSNIAGWAAAGLGAVLLGSGLIWLAVDDDGVDDVGLTVGPGSLTAIGAF